MSSRAPRRVPAHHRHQHFHRGHYRPGRPRRLPLQQTHGPSSSTRSSARRRIEVPAPLVNRAPSASPRVPTRADSFAISASCCLHVTVASVILTSKRLASFQRTKTVPTRSAILSRPRSGRSALVVAASTFSSASPVAASRSARGEERVLAHHEAFSREGGVGDGGQVGLLKQAKLDGSRPMEVLDHWRRSALIQPISGSGEHSGAPTSRLQHPSHRTRSSAGRSRRGASWTKGGRSRDVRSSFRAGNAAGDRARFHPVGKRGVRTSSASAARALA